MSANPDPKPHNEPEQHEEVSTDGARQGVELHRMRWVLGVSVAAAVVAVGVIAFAVL